MNSKVKTLLVVAEGGLIAALAGAAARYYAAGGFGTGFTLLLGLLVLLCTWFLPAFSSLYFWVTVFLSGFLTFSQAGDTGTALLMMTLCFGAPISIVLCRNQLKQVKQMAYYALPLNGLIQVGGYLGYCKFHFGVWDSTAPVARMAERFSYLIELLRNLYAKVYEDAEVLEQLSKLLDLLSQSARVVSLQVLYGVAYTLMGLFFLSLFRLDRWVRKENGAGLGSWNTLIPTPGISGLYILGYLILNFVNLGNYYQPIAAAFTLFGFFYVFAAVYTLNGFFRKKQLHRALRSFLAVLLLGAAWLSAGGTMFSAYSLLMWGGWCVATFPRTPIKS